MAPAPRQPCLISLHRKGLRGCRAEGTIGLRGLVLRMRRSEHVHSPRETTSGKGGSKARLESGKEVLWGLGRNRSAPCAQSAVRRKALNNI